MVDGILRAPRGSTPRLVNGATQQAEAEVEEEEKEEEEEERPVYLRWEDGAGLDGEKFAVLPNDWPYNVPYGVRHYCVWSRVSLSPSIHSFVSPFTLSFSLLSQLHMICCRSSLSLDKSIDEP